MLKTLRQVAVRRTALLCCLAFAACGGDPETNDDAGAAVADAGARDSGTPPVDSGAQPDAGARDAAVPVQCNALAPACPDPAPTFADVQPIFQARCVSCHYGAVGGPWPLEDYGHIADWQSEVRGALVSCSMPPPGMGEIPDAERLAILNWLACGAKR